MPRSLRKSSGVRVWSSSRVFVSMCSHHFLPFTGLCWVAYLPDKHLIGASKPARLVNHYASRPQLQERLAQDVLDNFVEHVKPKGAMVLMRAVHGCMKCRGVRQQHGGMMDSALYGMFKSDQAARTEVLDLVKISLMEMKL